MNEAARLVLSRHGRTVWHQENRYAGSSDVDLDDLGRQQAAQLAEWTHEHRPAAVVSSPLRRALETARPSAAALGGEPVVVDALREVHFGVAEGRTLPELARDDPDAVALFRADPVAHHFPDGEPTAAAAARGAAALRALAAAHPGQTVLVVAHNTLLRLAMCELLGISTSSYRQVFPRIENGALTLVSVGPQGNAPAALLSLNVPLPAPRAVPPVTAVPRPPADAGRLAAP